MVLFFINGAMKIEKYEYLPENNSIDFYEYKMRFLTESEEPEMIKITMADKFNNTVSFNIKVFGLQVIELDCTPFIEKFNHSRQLYVRVNYKVEFEDDQRIINGSFPIISPNYKKSLSIASVSCNNNQQASDSRDYKYEVISPNGLWTELNRKAPDIILHVGNQIYGDYIYDTSVGKRHDDSYDNGIIYNEYANLYRTAYNEPNQAEAMRNSLNLMVLEANDIYTSFGSRRSDAVKSNRSFTPYYTAGMKAYLNYQYQLYNDLHEEYDIDEIDGYQSVNSAMDEFSDILLGDSSIFYSVNYGNYTFILMDERYELYHRNVSISDRQIAWINDVIKKTDCKRIVLVSPRPIGNLTRSMARIYGYISSDGADDLLHPDNYDQTLKFLNVINSYSFGRDITIISGYVRKTFINDVKVDEKFIVMKQLATGAITRAPTGNDTLTRRLSDWLIRKVDEFLIENYTIGEKEKLSHGNSFGYIENDKIYNYIQENFDDLYCSWLTSN